MYELIIESGETLWNTNGTHALGSDGIAMKANEQTVINFDTEEAYNVAVAMRADAEARGIPK